MIGAGKVVRVGGFNLSTLSSSILGIRQGGFDTLMKPLFANGEQGFAYDPNDLTTLYQDAAGTIPVTAQGQPVGLILDKSKGAVLGSDVSKPFNSDWSSEVGKIYVENSKLISTSYANTFSTLNNVVLESGRFYEVVVNMQQTTRGTPRVALGDNIYSVPAGRVGEYRFVGQSSKDTNLLRIYSGWLNEGGDWVMNSISVKKLAGNHAYQTVSASRPILRKNDVTGAYYLEFDGTDDFLQTNNIDFTSTDKVSLFAGVRKLSDAVAMIVEFSSSITSNNGTFYLARSKPTGTSDINYSFATKGTLVTYSLVDGFAAPHSAILTANSVISNDVNNFEVSGVLASSTGDQGTGNYGNHPLFIGRRAGTSLPFNGHLYSLIGIGRLTTDSETKALEKAIAKNIGVTLNV